MPELPEVHTTATGLQHVLPGLTISLVWSDMWSDSKLAKNTIKDRGYFPYFKKYAMNTTVISVRRRAKYILIDLDNGFTIIIHMKMTGHLMYGQYQENKQSNGKEWSWVPQTADFAHTTQTSQTKTPSNPLLDPYNRFIHVVFTFIDSKGNSSHLVFCDSRKFGTIVIEKTSTLFSERLSHLGPEPLEASFTLAKFTERLIKSPTRAIKTVLMDQAIVAGIGNIYSDEMLHSSHILPTRTPKSLNTQELSLLFVSMKNVLKMGINFGGDSMSDYRNIHGERGNFQEKHLVYLRTGLACKTPNCDGVIVKEKINGRSAHYCLICQR